MHRNTPLLTIPLALLVASCQPADNQQQVTTDSGLDSSPTGEAAVASAGDNGLPHEVDTGWFTEVSERIATDTRSFREQQPGRFSTTVRGLRAELGPDGLLATNSAGDGELLLRFSAWGREGLVEQVDMVSPLLGGCATSGQMLPDGSCLRRVELPHPGLTEYWQTTPAGIEQAWEIEQRPAGQGLLLLHLDIEQAIHWQLDNDALGAQLLDSSGSTWRYAGLQAWDARGEPLATLMETTAAGLRIVVYDEGALYPVTVDPALTEGTKLTASDAVSFDDFGYTVSSAGDVDGDGYDDVIVGAYGDDDDTGSAYVYQGSSGGIDSSSETKLTASDGALNDYFGFSVSGAGDVDGDGYDDLIVGAHGDDNGSAYVYLGSSGGIDAGSETKLTASDGEYGAYFGQSVSDAGDVNGDGYDDLIVGAYGDDSGFGSAYVYLGSTDGIDSSGETKLTASDGASNDYFGWSVSGAGDVDGDGYDDLIVGAYGDDDDGYYSGSAYHFFGSCRTSWYADADADGYGDALDSVDACTQPTGYVTDSTDCDDADSAINPGATELCDSVDNDCDGAIDDADSGVTGQSTWYIDGDGDGYGSTFRTWVACVPPSGYVDNDDDCDDRDAAMNPAITEVCDGVDNDCDGTVDEGDSADASTWYADDDGDSYGDATSATVACSIPSGHVADDTDCDDSAVLINPAATEVCDGVDNDCDGTVDEDDSTDASIWYADADDDSYGDASVTDIACSAPTGYVADAADCDDDDASIHPSASDACGDGVDSDCDGTGGPDDDDDGDGLSYAEELALGSNDCDTDSDDDGLDDGDEVNTHGTDPTLADSDADGLTDGAEVDTHGSDPNDSDSDDDGLSDGAEVDTHGTDPNDDDSDDDGLSDSAEVDTHGSDPNDSDSDDEGLSDGAEVDTHGTDPNDSDSDDDGLSEDRKSVV